MNTNHIRIADRRISILVVGVLSVTLCLQSQPSQAQSPGSIRDLATQADMVFVGGTVGEAVNTGSPGEISGQIEIESADVSGDGVADLLIGVPFADGVANSPRANAGAVYVILGATGQPSSVRDLQLTPPDVMIIGAEASDRLGNNLTVGDFNGDGVKDIIIGAPFGDGPANSRMNVGEVYVIFGGSQLARTPLRDIGSPTTGADVTLYGWGGFDNTPDLAGASVASGDVNGDGVDDVAVGAPSNSGPIQNRARILGGAIYVFFGQRNVARGTVRDAAMAVPVGANLVIYGRANSIPGSRDSLGGSLGRTVVMGDLNGDSVPDIVSSAQLVKVGLRGLESDPSETYGVLGRRNLSTTQQTIIDIQTGNQRVSGAGSPDFTISAAEVGDGAGNALAVGDLNGDSFMDIAIGAPTAAGPNTARPQSGHVYVVFGTATPRDRDLAKVAADVTIRGAESGDEVGFSLAIGDVNRDQIGDLIMGAPTADGVNNLRNAAGEVLVVYGGANLTGLPVRDLAQGNQGPNLMIVGVALADQSGYSVASGDFNNDGADDVILSSPFSDGAGGVRRSKAGASYIVYGN